MKIAIVTNFSPFKTDSSEFFTVGLKKKLEEYGHEALIVKIPFHWNPPEKILEQIIACRLLKIPFVDKVIGLKFPAYYIKHDNKILWLLRQFKQGYDLWGTEFREISDSSEKSKIHESIIKADNIYLNECKQIFTNSNVVSDRLKKYNSLTSTILHPPLINAEKYYCENYGDFIFYPCRISTEKKLYLVVEAMKCTKTNVTLIIAGKPNAKADLDLLYSIVKKNNLDNKVKIIADFIPEEEKIKYYADCLGCVYIPYDKDFYGFEAFESYHAKKPVVACNDIETGTVVINNSTGYTVIPKAKLLAKAFDKLYIDKNKAKSMGEKGFDNLKTLNISWDNIIKRLTE